MRQWETLPNQLLQGEIDNVGEVLQCTCSLSTGPPHGIVRLVAPPLDANTIADEQHVSAMGRTGVIASQVFRNREIVTA